VQADPVASPASTGTRASAPVRTHATAMSFLMSAMRFSIREGRHDNSRRASLRRDGMVDWRIYALGSAAFAALTAVLAKVGIIDIDSISPPSSERS